MGELHRTSNRSLQSNKNNSHHIKGLRKWLSGVLDWYWLSYCWCPMLTQGPCVGPADVPYTHSAVHNLGCTSVNKDASPWNPRDDKRQTMGQILSLCRCTNTLVVRLHGSDHELSPSKQFMY